MLNSLIEYIIIGWDKVDGLIAFIMGWRRGHTAFHCIIVWSLYLLLLLLLFFFVHGEEVHRLKLQIFLRTLRLTLLIILWLIMLRVITILILLLRILIYQIYRLKLTIVVHLIAAILVLLGHIHLMLSWDYAEGASCPYRRNKTNSKFSHLIAYLLHLVVLNSV